MEIINQIKLRRLYLQVWIFKLLVTLRRLLYDLYDKNSENVINIMKSIKDNSFKIEQDKLKDLQIDFVQKV